MLAFYCFFSVPLNTPLTLNINISITLTSWLVYNAYVNVFLKFQSDIRIIEWVITFKAKIIGEITLETPH